MANYNAQYKNAGDQAEADARLGKGLGQLTSAVIPAATDWYKKLDATGGNPDYAQPGINSPVWGGVPDPSLADGGKIEGPGTGTSDSITAIKKPGSYILSADTVRALGEKKLTDLMEKAGVRRRFGGEGGGNNDDSGVGVRLSNGEWSMPPEVTKYHGEEFFNKLQQKFHRPVFADDNAMANGGAIRKRRLPANVEDAIFGNMPTRALGRRY